MVTLASVFIFLAVLLLGPILGALICVLLSRTRWYRRSRSLWYRSQRTSVGTPPDLLAHLLRKDRVEIAPHLMRQRSANRPVA